MNTFTKRKLSHSIERIAFLQWRMVKILANGEIVPDDDPRVSSSNARPRNTNSNAPPQRGGIPPPNDNQQYQGGQQVSIFQSINQRLLGLGIPRWNIGDTVVEPIVSVGLVLAVMLFGIQGLLFGAILFAVSQWSTNGPPEFIGRMMGTQQQGGSGGNSNSNRRGNNSGGGGGGSSGSGHRLGRS